MVKEIKSIIKTENEKYNILLSDSVSFSEAEMVLKENNIKANLERLKGFYKSPIWRIYFDDKSEEVLFELKYGYLFFQMKNNVKRIIKILDGNYRLVFYEYTELSEVKDILEKNNINANVASDLSELSELSNFHSSLFWRIQFDNKSDEVFFKLKYSDLFFK